MGCPYVYRPGACYRCERPVEPGEACAACHKVTATPGRCPRCEKPARVLELADYFGAETAPPDPLPAHLLAVWRMAQTLRSGEDGRAGWVEVETMLDRLEIGEPWRRDAWREAVWTIEEAAAYGQEVRMARDEEEREEAARRRGR